MGRMSGMRIIYLSPHLDDAVLSAGGLIHDQVVGGERVEIWTIMSGFPGSEEPSDFARKMHTEWGTSSGVQTVRARRAEDLRAAGVLGAHPRHFGFLDCIYRRDAEGRPLYQEALYTPPHACDAGLPTQIARTISKGLRRDDVTVCQLGIGEHVDHLLVRKAAELLGSPLLYDADLPYLLNHPDELEPMTASMASGLEPVSVAGRAAWLRAIQEYRSQLSTLFESPESMSERLGAHWTETGGIRLWWRQEEQPGREASQASLGDPNTGDGNS